jgi:hypothetical protein
LRHSNLRQKEERLLSREYWSQGGLMEFMFHLLSIRRSDSAACCSLHKPRAADAASWYFWAKKQLAFASLLCDRSAAIKKKYISRGRRGQYLILNRRARTKAAEKHLAWKRWKSKARVVFIQMRRFESERRVAQLCSGQLTRGRAREKEICIVAKIVFYIWGDAARREKLNFD